MRKIEKYSMIIMFSFAAVLVIGAVVIFGKFQLGELFPNTDETTVAVEETQVETIAPEDFVDMAEFKVEKNDHSITDKATGKNVVDVFYQQITLLYGNTQRTDAINKIITKDYNDFLEEITDINQSDAGGHFRYTADVTNNSSGIFSIKITKDIDVKGKKLTDYYGMTFDLNSGKELTLRDITSQSDSGLKSDLKPLVWEAVKDSEYMYPDADRILTALESYEYLYYVEDGKIIVTLPTGTVGTAELGAVIVDTGKSAY